MVVIWINFLKYSLKYLDKLIKCTILVIRKLKNKKLKIMENLNALLNGRNIGIFKNNKGEYCRIKRYDLGSSNPKIQVIFAKGVFDIATRNAINTTSEKKILELIKEEGFALES